MNLLLLKPEEVAADGTVELRGRRALHLRSVLGVAVGDQVRLGVVRGPTGSATVRQLDGERVLLEARLDGIAVAAPAVELILAVPRPKVLSRVLETAASMGVRRIDLVNAWRVDKSYFGSRRLEAAALERSLVLGCEQGGTTWLPEVQIHRLLVPFLHSLPARLAERAASGVVAHPRATGRLEQVLPRGDAGAVLLAVGPEGGWIDSELDSFAELGFRPASMGSAVLRVEAAVAALLAEVSLLGRLASGDGGR